MFIIISSDNFYFIDKKDFSVYKINFINDIKNSIKYCNYLFIYDNKIFYKEFYSNKIFVIKFIEGGNWEMIQKEEIYHKYYIIHNNKILF